MVGGQEGEGSVCRRRAERIEDEAVGSLVPRLTVFLSGYLWKQAIRRRQWPGEDESAMDVNRQDES